MNLLSPKEIKNLLAEADIKPSKRYGQNFLINKGILKKIIDASEIKKDDIVLEVGPGPGALTKELSKKAKRVIAVEKDRNMVRILEKVLQEEKIENVDTVNEDILKLNLEKTQEKINLKSNYKLIANIPYNITSSLIRKFLEAKNKPEKIILMIQKEVAQRICEKKKMSLLSLSVQFYAKPKILFRVLKGSFFPAPKVDSAVIEIIPKKTIPIKSEIFFKFVRAGFSSPRKQLAGNLAETYDLSKDDFKKIFEKIKLDQKIRAEDLTLKSWIELIEMVK